MLNAKNVTYPSFQYSSNPNLRVERLVDGVLRLGLHLSPGLAVDVVGVELGHIGRQIAPE